MVMNKERLRNLCDLYIEALGCPNKERVTTCYLAILEETGLSDFTFVFRPGDSNYAQALYDSLLYMAEKDRNGKLLSACMRYVILSKMWYEKQNVYSAEELQCEISKARGEIGHIARISEMSVSWCIDRLIDKFDARELYANAISCIREYEKWL